MFGALFYLSNNTALHKNAIFCLFCFPHVMQKQTLIVVNIKWSSDGQVCQQDLYPKNIKTYPSSSYNQKY